MEKQATNSVNAIKKAIEIDSPVMDKSNNTLWFPKGFGINVGMLGDLFSEYSPDEFSFRLRELIKEYLKLISYVNKIPDKQSREFGVRPEIIERMFELSDFLKDFQENHSF